MFENGSIREELGIIMPILHENGMIDYNNYNNYNIMLNTSTPVIDGCATVLKGLLSY